MTSTATRSKRRSITSCDSASPHPVKSVRMADSQDATDTRPQECTILQVLPQPSPQPTRVGWYWRHSNTRVDSWIPYFQRSESIERAYQCGVPQFVYTNDQGMFCIDFTRKIQIRVPHLTPTGEPYPVARIHRVVLPPLTSHGGGAQGPSWPVEWSFAPEAQVLTVTEAGAIVRMGASHGGVSADNDDDTPSPCEAPTRIPATYLSRPYTLVAHAEGRGVSPFYQYWSQAFAHTANVAIPAQSPVGHMLTPGYSIQIKTIHQVMNHRCREAFEWRRDVMQRELDDGMGVIPIHRSGLFHGTAHANVASILAQGLTSSPLTQSSSRALIGHGIYTATISSLAIHYSEEHSPGSNTEEREFVVLGCEALPGVFEVGRAGQTAPTRIPDTAAQFYTSTCDNTQLPTQFCLWRPDQVLVVAVITFTCRRLKAPTPSSSSSSSSSSDRASTPN